MKWYLPLNSSKLVPSTLHYGIFSALLDFILEIFSAVRPGKMIKNLAGGAAASVPACPFSIVGGNITLILWGIFISLLTILWKKFGVIRFYFGNILKILIEPFPGILRHEKTPRLLQRGVISFAITVRYTLCVRGL